MHIPSRTIPALDRDVSAIGFGCMGISWAYSSADSRSDDAGRTILEHAAGAGVTFFDTSDAYANGHNESAVGRAFTGQNVVIATKGGLIGSTTNGLPTLARNGRPEHLRQACEDSLRRLGLVTIDLYYLHRVDDKVPIEDSWGAMSELVTAGKVRSLGLSEVTVAQAETAHRIHPVAAVQSELSVWTRDPLGTGSTPDGSAVGNMVDWTREHNAIFVPFSPLGRGFLTGALDTTALRPDDYRSALPRFESAAAQQNQRIVTAVTDVAARHNSTPAAVALAWVLAQGKHVIPIPGTTNPHHFDNNFAATDITLSSEDLNALDAAPAAVGTRY